MDIEIPSSGNILPRHKSSTNYEFCIICQVVKIREPLKELKSVASLMHAVECRNDSCTVRLREELPFNETFLEKNPKWHASCRQSFTSKRNLTFVRKEFSNKDSDRARGGANTKWMRKSVNQCFDYRNMCIICAEPEKPKKGSKFKMRLVETWNRQRTFYEKCKLLKDVKPEVLLRVEGDGNNPIDMIATEVSYHDVCMKNFMAVSNTPPPPDLYNEAFCDLIKEIDVELNNGKVFISSSLLKTYKGYLCSRGVDASKYRMSSLKKRMKDHYGETIIFWHQNGSCDIIFKGSALKAGDLIREIGKMQKHLNENYLPIDDSSDTEEENALPKESEGSSSSSNGDNSLMYMISKRIRSDIEKIKSDMVYENSQEWEVTYEQANNLIPNTLYNMLSYILFDAQPPMEEDSRVLLQKREHEQILNIIQDILYVKKFSTPKHVGLAVYVYHRTRSRDIITALNRFGHCISYTNLQRILTTIAIKMQTKSSGNETYIPSNIKPGKFTHFAIDNLDFQENTLDGSSTHVTSMVIFQSDTNPDHNSTVSRVPVPVKITRQQTLREIKGSYDVGNSHGRGIKRKLRPETLQIDPEWLLEESTPELSYISFCWMLARTSGTKIIEYNNEGHLVSSYKSFCAEISQCTLPVTAIGYMPFIPHSPTEPSVVADALKICIKTNKALGNRFTIVSQDLAVYEISYALRRQKPDEFPNMILRLGGFHLLMNFLGAIGKIMMDTGIVKIFVEAKVLLEGTANKVMAGKGFYQAVNAHIELYESMLGLWWQAFEDWLLLEHKDLMVVVEIGILLDELKMVPKNSTEISRQLVISIDGKFMKLKSLMDEFNSSRLEYRTHRLWLMYLELVEIALQFMHAERDASWSNHLLATSRMLPYIISAGHHKYGGCIVNYLEEMKKLPDVAPEVADQFNAGLFTVKRTEGRFNCIWSDQALECSQNCDAKGRSGMAGLKGITMSDAAREKWFLTLPFTTAISSAVKFMLHMDISDTVHHEDTHATTIHQLQARDTIMEVITKGINPFTTKTKELLNIMTGQTAPDNVSASLLSAKELGKEALCSYLSGDHPTLEIIKLKTFATVNTKVKRNPVLKIKDNLYNEISMLKRTLLANESRLDASSEYLKDLMSHEILPYPPALAEVDDATVGFRLRGGNKASVIHYMKTRLGITSWPEELVEANQNLTTGYVVDLMAFIRTKVPHLGESVKSFAERVLLSIISNRPTKCSEIHIVADRYDGLYNNGNLPGDAVRLKDASGCHARRMTSAKVHHLEKHMAIENWKDILSNADSKANLVQLLFEVWETSSQLLPNEVSLHLAGGFLDRLKSVSLNSKDGVNFSQAASSTQEEGDTRVILHAKLCVENQCKRVIICANDTDIVILALYFINRFTDDGLQEFWIAFHDCFIPIHKIAQELEVSELSTLPFLHAISGCDTTSYIYLKGKKTFLNAMKKTKIFPKLQRICNQLENLPDITDDLFNEILSVTRNLMCIVYGKQYGEYESLNKLRTNLYTKKRDLRSLPPTEDAFRQHVKRAIFQTCIWVKADQARPMIPDPFKFGWIREDTVKPLLTTISPVPTHYAESAYCVCKKKCGPKCPCRKLGSCALLCACGGTNENCSNSLVLLECFEDE